MSNGNELEVQIQVATGGDEDDLLVALKAAVATAKMMLKRGGVGTKEEQSCAGAYRVKVLRPALSAKQESS